MTNPIHSELWLYWMQAAVRHTARARRQREIATAENVIGPKKIRATLEELPAAMQAIASAAFSIDGFDFAAATHAGLPAQPGPRPKAILARLDMGFNLGPPKRVQYEKDLRWLFDSRNSSVHAGIRVDPSWTHPSGISVSAIARELGLESAERAVSIASELLRVCLASPKPNGGLDDWVAGRRDRLRMALEG